jgi:hypothetical protein
MDNNEKHKYIQNFINTINNKDQQNAVIRLLNLLENTSFIKVYDVEQPIVKPFIYNIFRTMNNDPNRKIFIAMDAEFQSIYSTEYQEYQNKKHYIRELGLIIFIVYNNNVYMIQDLFVNFKEIKNNNLFLSEKFCTVDKNTRMLMIDNSNKLQKYLEDIIGNFYEIIEAINDLINKKKNNMTTNLNIIEKNIENGINNIGNYSKLFINRYYSTAYNILKKILENIKNNKFDQITQDMVEYTKIVNNIYKYKDNFVNEVCIKETPECKNEQEHINSIIKNQLDIYHNDKLVISRQLEENQQIVLLNSLNTIVPISCFIVKGNNDFKIIVNHGYYHKLQLNNFKYPIHNDIAIFNYFSTNLYGNGKLETTYKGIIKSEFYKNNIEKEFERVIKYFNSKISNNFHNPLYDAYTTIIVALAFNGLIYKGLYDSKTTEFIGGNTNLYYKKYKKYKSKYFNLIKNN